MQRVRSWQTLGLLLLVALPLTAAETALDRYVKTYLLEGMHTITPGDEELYTITEDIQVIKAIVNHHRDTSNAFNHHNGSDDVRD